MFRMKPSKKSRWDFSAETSALRARFVGNADKPHTCADEKCFLLRETRSKKLISKARFAGKLRFFLQSWTEQKCSVFGFKEIL